MLIVGVAGEEVLLGLHFSVGTVRADTALFGQPVLAISARLYTQSMVAQSVPRHLSRLSLRSFTLLRYSAVV